MYFQNGPVRIRSCWYYLLLFRIAYSYLGIIFISLYYHILIISINIDKKVSKLQWLSSMTCHLADEVRNCTSNTEYRSIISYVSFIFAEVSIFFSVEITWMYDNLFITFLVPIYFIFVDLISVWSKVMSHSAPVSQR